MSIYFNSFTKQVLLALYSIQKQKLEDRYAVIAWAIRIEIYYFNVGMQIKIKTKTLRY